MKKLMIFLVCLFMITGMVFAGGNKEAAPQAKNIKIVFWDMLWGTTGDYDKTAKKLVAQYMQENPGITIEYQSLPWDNYYQVFLTAITSGSGPDIATAGSQTPMQFATMGEILPVDPIIEKWKKNNDPILKDFIPGILETNKLNGNYIALPWQTDTRAITYRTDLFTQAGITTLPTDWKGLLDVMRKLKKTFPDKYPLVFAGDLGGAQNIMMYLTASNNIGPITADYKSNFTSKAIRECIQFIATMLDEDLIPKATVSYKNADAQRLFLTENAVMHFGAPEAVFYVDKNLGSKISLLPPLKGYSGDKARTVYWANSIAAYKQTKNPKETLDFLEWWVKNSKLLFTEGLCGKIPVLSTIAADPFFEKSPLERDVIKTIIPSYTHATYPIQNFYPAFGQINGERYLGNAAQKVLSGRRDFDTILIEDDVNVKKALELQK